MMQIRIARPTADLQRAVAFYRLLELPAVASFEDHDGYTGVVLGLPDASRQLELVHREGERPTPTEEDQLVLYLGSAECVSQAAERIRSGGFEPRSAANPYWERTGACCFVDPDGYWLILSPDALVEPVPSAPVGYAFGSIDEMGDGVFRKVRQELGVKAFGVNVLVLAPGVVARPHYHEEQDELYFVHRGRARFALPGESRELGPGGLCHVESTTPRQVSSVGEEDLVMLVVGAKGGYIGRDGGPADPSKLG
jgi:mannose-6-phosphate isomerase-like protein (cupin superfamily)